MRMDVGVGSVAVLVVMPHARGTVGQEAHAEKGSGGRCCDTNDHYLRESHRS